MEVTLTYGEMRFFVNSFGEWQQDTEFGGVDFGLTAIMRNAVRFLAEEYSPASGPRAAWEARMLNDLFFGGEGEIFVGHYVDAPKNAVY